MRNPKFSDFSTAKQAKLIKYKKFNRLTRFFTFISVIIIIVTGGMALNLTLNGVYEYKTVSSEDVEKYGYEGIEFTGYKGYSKQFNIPDKIDGKNVVKLGDMSHIDAKYKVPSSIKILGRDSLNGLGNTYDEKNKRLILPDNGVEYLCTNAGSLNNDYLTLPKSLKVVESGAFYKIDHSVIQFKNSRTTIKEGAFGDIKKAKTSTFSFLPGYEPVILESSALNLEGCNVFLPLSVKVCDYNGILTYHGGKIYLDAPTRPYSFNEDWHCHTNDKWVTNDDTPEYYKQNNGSVNIDDYTYSYVDYSEHDLGAFLVNLETDYYFETLRVSPTVNNLPVKSIYYLGNNSCRNLYLPDTLVQLDWHCLRNCNDLVKIVFGQDSELKYIDNRAIQNKPSLQYVVIPKSVERIENCFNNCPYLENLFYYGNAEDWEKIKITDDNNVDLNSKVKFYSETKVENGWHLVDGEPTLWA